LFVNDRLPKNAEATKRIVNEPTSIIFEFMISISSNKVKTPKIIGNKINGLA
jgi:hypothetical protein